METSAKPDICTPDDIRGLIDAFYAQVGRDELLGPVFAARIPAGHWPAHLDTMTRFWTAALLGQAAGYRGNPGAKHLDLPIEPAHFTRWLRLFGQTVDALFAGDNATEIKVRAHRMGELFQAKIAMTRANRNLSIM
ncbi:group III truncated hemoglobin [Hymenobacter sp. H14-R3]|uniref:group III truncated hemoglobin n=1 Tax=Hymenobacter sp. H14-R3 TaxID=3046308 RepID=UPI0024BBC30E|nr:group III truncated hemoglobin [Hymenobacter sp. H14-R3]MDJ0366484.1 group III truncated hemoglobin [Hymenobacter sp. H14-R3]